MFCRTTKRSLLGFVKPKIRTYSTEELKRTVLYDLHVNNGGKMVPFGGWSMPVQYQSNIKDSHLHTRSAVSLFDVSHMLQLKFRGKDATEFLEKICVVDAEGLKDDTGSYTLMLNDSGGIIDDLIVNKISSESYYVVANAGCADKDLKHISSMLASFKDGNHSVEMQDLSKEFSLLALQGPKMAEVLGQGVSFDLNQIPFMYATSAEVFGVPDCRITRCGYTGEDGVEISVPTARAVELAEALLSSSSKVKLAGLGARDSLRLEAGLCLYGNDLDETTTPIEAALAWTISKRRRSKGGFVGSGVVMEQLKGKVSRKRVGFTSTGPVARTGCDILDQSGQKIGKVTSGCPSPSLNLNVAIGYVTPPNGKIGHKVHFSVRNKPVEATVTKLPFLPAKYFFG